MTCSDSMKPLFTTITSEDWRRGLAAARLRRAGFRQRLLEALSRWKVGA